MREEERFREALQRAAKLVRAPDGQEKRLIYLEPVRRLAREFGLSPREVEILALKQGIIPARYERNMGTVGLEGQLKLLQSTVAVVGAGGLGGWVIEGLARMGVGHLIVVDGDFFEENNLNRQALCHEADLGKPKTERAREHIRQVNSAVEVTCHQVIATEETFPQLLAGAEVIVDALDTLPARLALQRAARQMGVPLVHGAIGGYIGQVMTIFPEDPGLLALYGEEGPERGVERFLGNPAATPMMVAAWQIQEVIKILLGQEGLLRRKLLLMDAEAGTAEVVSLE